MKSNLIVVLIFSVLGLQSLTAESSGLTKSQGQVLKKAENRFEIRVLTGTIAGIDRTVVIWGETHANNREDFEIARRVLAEFPCRGIEGVELGTAAYVAYLATHFYARQIISHPLEYGSTIRLAHVELEMAAKADEIIAKYNLNNLTPAELAKELIVLHEDGSILPFTGADFLNLKLRQPHLEFIQLEKGYVLSFAQNANVISLPVAITSLGSTLVTGCAWAISGKLSPPKSRLRRYGRRTFLASAATLITSFGIKLSEIGDLVGPRNDYMVENLWRSFVTAPTRNQIFVAVGREHVPGMVDLLKKRGFSESKSPF